MMTQKRLCPLTSAMTLKYMSQRLRDWKGRLVTVLSHCIFTISLAMETSLQMPMLHILSLGTTMRDRDILKLWISPPHPASMRNYAAEMRLNAQVREELDHIKTLSEKNVFYIEANVTLQYMC